MYYSDVQLFLTQFSENQNVVVLRKSEQRETTKKEIKIREKQKRALNRDGITLKH